MVIILKRETVLATNNAVRVVNFFKKLFVYYHMSSFDGRNQSKMTRTPEIKRGK